ncbi:MAG: hypothetical protein ABR530_00930 [Pyrinomonadaceae bacterium]
MVETIKAEKEHIPPERAFLLWIGMLLPPIAWGLQLQTLWLTSEYGCFTSDFFWNHIVSIIALLISAFGGYVAYAELQKWNRVETNDSPDPRSRRRFMAMIGLMTAALFTALIFAQWLPTLLGVPCDK